MSTCAENISSVVAAVGAAVGENVQKAADVIVVAPAAALPHLESVQRVKKIPLVEAAWNQSASTYGIVKGSSAVLAWTLNAAEATAQKAAGLAAAIASPVTSKLGTPIRIVDRTVVKGIDFVEDRVPLVKKQPQQIYELAKSYVAPLSNKMSAIASYGSRKLKAAGELTSAKAKGVLSAPAAVAYGVYSGLVSRVGRYWSSLFPRNKALAPAPAAPAPAPAAAPAAAPAPTAAATAAPAPTAPSK